MSNLKVIKEKQTPQEIIEQESIQAAIDAGYGDPYLSDQKSILFLEAKGKKYRRFITDFREIPHTNLYEDQIRQNVVDVTYCREELIPLIMKYGLQNPVWVTPTGKNSYGINHGHHRIFSNSHINGPESSIPCFVLSNMVYPILEDGTYGQPMSLSFLIELSKIQCNPPAKNISYKVADIPVQMGTLFASDPKMMGYNPTGNFPDREVFDVIMDFVHPKQFLHKATRTKIYNLWSKGKAGSKIVPVGYSDITNDLVKLNYDAGVTKTKTGKQSRAKFLEWYDEKNNIFLGKGEANSGTNFERNFCMTIIQAMGNGTIDKSTKYNFVIHCTVYKPAITLVKLNEQRKNQEDLMRMWNEYFALFGYSNVKFTKVIWPKQLVDPRDQTKVVSL